MVAEIRALGRKAISVACNVAKPDDVARLVDADTRATGADRPAGTLWRDQQHLRPFRAVVRASGSRPST